MPMPHPAVTPSTSFSVPGPTLSSRTPPPTSSGYTGQHLFTSPSPRTRPTRESAGLPFKSNPNSSPQNNYYHRHQWSVDSRSAPPAHQASPTQQHHVAFAATAFRPPSYSTFPASTPPPASSLLPPPRIRDYQPSSDRDPFNEQASQDSTPDSLKDNAPPRRRGHSRSSSAASALSDGIRNLNRWSVSTTSSRASNFTGLTKRISVDVLGGGFGSPNRKLHKSKPSTASEVSPRTSAPNHRRSESPAPALIPPLQSLPRISIGPSLEDEVRQANVLGGHSPTRHPRYIRRPSEDLEVYWDGAPQIPEDKSGPSPLLDSAELLLPAATITRENTMPYTQHGESRGHSRSRSGGANGSADTSSSSNPRDRDRDRDRERERPNRPASQKAMLSKALQKANVAVQLDNAQNIEGARRAYAEACALLQQVLLRTSAEEDRRKLEAIHKTYTSRIDELDENLAEYEHDDKELPHRPESNSSQGTMNAQINNHAEDSFSSRPARDREYEREAAVSYSVPTSATRRQFTSRAPPSLSIQTPRDASKGTSSYLTEQHSLQSAFSRTRLDSGSVLPPRMHNGYMVPPLSPLRPLSPNMPPPPPPPPNQGSPERVDRMDFSMSGALLAPSPAPNGHRREESHESVSWLDPIDESGGSAASSVHSRSSSMGIRRKHIRAASGDTEAEFDAALDDAIEAAYDEGYEPEQFGTGGYREESQSAVAESLRRVEEARERVRQSEREALELANEREQRLRLQQQLEDEEYRRHGGNMEDIYGGMTSEDEEERILEEMSRGYIIEDFALGPQTRQPAPRESDSSGLTGRTWHSSFGSNAPTSTTMLTTVSENALPEPTGPLPPPPTQALPQLPPQPPSAGSQGSSQSVRNRRLSGHNLKQLKIETVQAAPAVPIPTAPVTAGAAFPQQPKTGSYIVQQRQALSAGPNRTTGPLSSRPAVPTTAPGVIIDGSSTPPLPTGFTQDEQPRSGSPSVPRQVLRKNFSASSLKSVKSRNLSVSHIDDVSDISPGTPVTNQFGVGGSYSRLPSIPSLPSLPTPSFRDRMDTSGTGGMHLFDSGFHSPTSRPGSPTSLVADVPASLEPCPNDVMLRPFWLMRCLYQTLCHPRGGYLSNKLFVPRDVWRVKGVKLKNLEDKIANCDYLTAALQKLARVDTCDADAVLEEMQSLEGVLEHVQTTLTRKLGSEVGVHGTSTMFKDASVTENEAAAMPRSASISAKSSSFSWRRLRNKNSSANLPSLATGYGGKGGSGGASNSTTPVDGAGRDLLLPSLPMTSHPTSRPAKRDLSSVVFTGPNANYMSSLARLFDAAQSIGEFLHWDG
ncbi:hypothetical protein B0T19DRAFT_87101 [Cercophora scortea]|uniref:MIT domain-containing protein n=1 Tax=Cercophora scortea TaxID=314031 RepID=A0AAE0IVD3_9PEZI|nr:hypothetical protein B0T19DRAFT_87101 [Cercophora scortea]